MPITLTTPYHGYGEVKVVSTRLDRKRKLIFLAFEYGDTVDERWVPGALQIEEKLVRNTEQVTDGHEEEITPADPAYDVLVATSLPTVTFISKDGNPRWAKLTIAHPVHGDLDLWVQLSYAAVSSNFYQHAIDQGWYEGTIQ